MKKVACSIALLFCIGIALPQVVNGFTATDLMGEYNLVGFSITYPGYATITHDLASSYSGRASMTTKGLVMEMSGYIYGSYVYQWSCAFYSVSGSRIYAGIVGELSQYVNIQINGDTLTTSGSQYDENGNYYNFSYTWKKIESYYTQGLLNAAVSEVSTNKDQIIDQKDLIIAQLNSEIESKNQTISTLNQTLQQKNENIANLNSAIQIKNQEIENLNTTIGSMYTSSQVELAVGNAVAEKDQIIASKEQIIEELSDLNGDGRIDMQDIIWGLKILTGQN
jgi:hypothetical protein